MLGLVDPSGLERDRLPSSCEKRIWIALGQKLSRALGHLRTDEHELGMELPRRDVPVRGRLKLVYRPFPGSSDGLGRNAAKPGFELERSFEGDGSQITNSYRRRASLT